MDDARKLREKKRTERASLDPEEVREKSLKIKEKLFALPEFTRAKTIAFYAAKKNSGEVRTQEMIEESLKSGKRVLVPFVDGEEIEFTEISGLSDLKPGAFNVPEPPPAVRRRVDPEEIDLIVVPGVVFDMSGGRMGYGKGYYDRFLHRLLAVRPDACVVGLALEIQVVEKIPERKSTDSPVQILITEERVLRFK